MEEQAVVQRVTRTFIAVDIGEPVRIVLADVIQTMAQELPELRWVDPQGIHLTLAFLGELNDQRLREAMRAAEAASCQVPPFAFRLSHLGIFDSLHHARVIWMGIDEPSGSLQQLHRLLNRELEQRGFPVEKRPFSPHLTLARVKTPLKANEQDRLRRFLMETKVSANSSVDRLCVMKSELLRSGARYTHLEDYLLAREQM
jgi:2'-5' RNA ligase